MVGGQHSTLAPEYSCDPKPPRLRHSTSSQRAIGPRTRLGANVTHTPNARLNDPQSSGTSSTVQMAQGGLPDVANR
jgi:hypothetical protein